MLLFSSSHLSQYLASWYMATKKEFLFELMYGQTASSCQLMYLLNELAYVRLGEPDQVDQYGRRHTKKSLKHQIDADLTLSRQIKKYFLYSKMVLANWRS